MVTNLPLSPPFSHAALRRDSSPQRGAFKRSEQLPTTQLPTTQLPTTQLPTTKKEV
ncbi:hypothetical protein [Ruminococcus sp.]|uniref:hypothetical protein n=1 Tax=Ruminococcus sp. TaxID=41978 RepID=UPI002E7918C3|nr:hypothetical protein [Ruminococcus sp.]MEE1263315.1 hypothetical protein [Ruminococcus sp.]